MNRPSTPLWVIAILLLAACGLRYGIDKYAASQGCRPTGHYTWDCP